MNLCPDCGAYPTLVEWTEPSLLDDREKRCVEWSCRCGWSRLVEVEALKVPSS